MKKALPLNFKKEIFRWGPAPGRFFYMSDFIDAIYLVYPKIFPGFAWPKTLSLFKDGRMFWINEFPAIRKAGEKVFLAYMLPKKSRLALRRKWEGVVSKLQKFEKKLSRLELPKLNDDELHYMGKEFHDLLMEFWVWTVPMELGNYGSDHLLSKKLKKYIPKESERQKALEILTAPEELSFYQKEEIALQKENNLQAHQQKYFWLHNSYKGTEVLPVSFFKKRKKQLPKDLAKKMRVHLNGAKRAKAKARKEYALPKEIMDIAYALSYGVAWQDERKKQIFIYLHYKDLFLREIARRKGYKFSELQNIGTLEAVNFVKKDIGQILRKRKGSFGFFCRAGKVSELNASLTVKYWKQYSVEKMKPKTNLIKGIVASSGKKGFARGRVKIVVDPFDSPGFKNGDVLVAPMTTPEYVFLMKKASAIITDAGGLTSHAAIVSRELSVPCIVGTKIATHVLRDGQMVEVDADKGIVKVISH